MKILFICLSNLKFDVETPGKEPLGGTESAICYLSTELVKLGHDVTLMCNSEEKTIQGVKHIPVSEDLSKIDPDTIIVTSAPQAIPGVKAAAPRAKVIMWNHMRPDQPVMQHFFDQNIAKEITHVVYVSESQQRAFVGDKLPATEPTKEYSSIVIGNAIAPCFENMFTSAQEIQETKKCRGVYTSTPFRGLAVLAKIQELPIEVFSSMNVYQMDDSPFTKMYENLKANDCLTLHGSVSQTELANRIRDLAFFVYPSIFAECHSIAILEAMAAGVKIITTDFASPQTEFIDSMSATNGSVDDYAKLLRKNINFFRSQPEKWSEKMWQQVQYVNREFTWKKKALEWEKHLHFLIGDLTIDTVEPKSN